MRTPSSTTSERGRSREPRVSSYEESDDQSFESYDSYDSVSDDDSYEPASDSKLVVQESTEYESDGSYSDSSDDIEPPNPSVSEYESDNSNDQARGPRIVTRKSSAVSASSTSNDEFEDETVFEEDSDGEFGEDKGFDTRNSNSEDTTEDEDESESESENDDDEMQDLVREGKVKMGEQDDDLFWKRYGYSQQIGNFGDESSAVGSNPFGEESSRENSSEENPSGSDVDDGDTFKDELYSQAFPSVAEDREDGGNNSDKKKKVRFGGSGSGGNFMERMRGWFKCPNFKCFDFKCFKCGSLFDFSGEIWQGNFKWYILGAIILIAIGGTVAAVLPKLKKTGAPKDPIPTMAPTVTPSVFLSPTLPPGQVMESITFFVLVPFGKENGVTEEELEIKFSAIFDVLTPQVLLNTTTLNDNNNADTSVSIDNQTAIISEEKLNDRMRLRGRQRRRRLDALSVKSPVPVAVVEMACADTVPNPGSDMCVKVTADIIVITDDGNIGFDYYGAVEDAINDIQLQAASEAIGSNLTVVILDEEDLAITQSPTTTASPTNSPRPTGSPAPTSSCYDRESQCEEWANQEPSECDVNPEYMWWFCMKSCGRCITNAPTTVSPTESPVAIPTVLPTATPSLRSEAPSSAATGSETSSNSLAPTTNENTTPSPTSVSCIDENDACAEFFVDGTCMIKKCVFWAIEGECDANPTYMQNNCANSCNKCDEETEVPTESPTPDGDLVLDPVALPPQNDFDCVDENARCAEWAEDEQCSINPDWMLENCKLSCNVCTTESNDGDGDTEGKGDDQGEDQTPLPPCVDGNDRCAEWAADNQCSSNPNYMLKNCKKSCSVCESVINDTDESSPSPCVDENDRCSEWASENQCSSNPGWMLENCKVSCGVCGTLEVDTSGAEECQDFKEDCYEFSDVGACLLTKCALWAAEGECQKNPSYMLDNCAKSCGDC